MPTTLELKTLNLHTAAREKADLLVVLVPDAAADAWQAEGSSSTAEAASAALSQAIAQAVQHNDLELGKAGSQLALYSVAQVAARRILLVAVGAGRPADVAKAVAGCSGALQQDGVKKAVVLSLLPQDDAPALEAAVRGVAALGYRYHTTKPSDKGLALQKVTVGVPSKAAAQAAFERAEGVAAGIALARELGNLPANHATPEYLAQTAQALAKSSSVIKTKVHALRDIERLKMGAFLSVARGSVQPPQFIELHYQGAGAAEPPVVLVGKGVTFDTGGISIKPAAGMDEMKFDMCGAASVLGVFLALAKLQPRINVVGLIPATENMPGGKATKPGDVVTSLSGQTIEILNTDAEGRLILCDALTYADRFKPRAVVDIATLTGACVIALGKARSGLYASDETLAQQLLQAGEQAQDLGWRMPLDDAYGEGLKSNFADMANVAGREAGSVTAAKFLQKFVGDWPWAHLDIAGTAWKSGNAKGATGRPVGLLVHYLLGQVQEQEQTPASAPRRATRKSAASTVRAAADGDATADASPAVEPKAKPASKKTASKTAKTKTASTTRRRTPPAA